MCVWWCVLAFRENIPKLAWENTVGGICISPTTNPDRELIGHFRFSPFIFSLYHFFSYVTSYTELFEYYTIIIQLSHCHKCLSKYRVWHLVRWFNGLWKMAAFTYVMFFFFKRIKVKIIHHPSYSDLKT